MRILHVINSRGPGGAEVLVRDLVLETASRGEVAGIAYLSKLRQETGFVPFETEFAGLLREHGIGSYEIGHHAKRNPLYGAWRLLRIVREFRPDVLHVHLQSGLLFRLIAGPLLPTGMVTVYTHHIDSLKFGERLFRLLTVPVDGFVAISKQTRQLLAGVVDRPIALIPNAVRLSLAAPRERRKPGPFTVLSVGRLFPQKNYPALIEAARLVFAGRPDLKGKLRFLIAGEGSERGLIESRISENGLAGAVILLGARTDIRELMRESDLFLMTSAYEGLPIALLEALHSRLPIVATDVGGCSEVIEPGENGFLAPAGDVRAIAQHILSIVDDPELQRRLGEGSAERAEDYNMRHSVKRHLDLYAELILRKGSQQQYSGLGVG